MHAPEIENLICAAVIPLATLRHVTTEATMAVKIRNVDSRTSSPLTLELFVTVAVAVIFPSISVLVSTCPITFAVDN